MPDPKSTPTPFTYHPIGIIRSPFSDIAGMPIQPRGASGVQGTIEIYPEYRDGLRDLDGFSRILLVYPFHRSTGYSLDVIPFLDTQARGVFATRAPKRPNAIGISVVRLVGIRDTTIDVEDIDILDGTPLFDIKPYVPAFDAYPGEKAGWFDAVSHNTPSARSDERFR